MKMRVNDFMCKSLQYTGKQVQKVSARSSKKIALPKQLRLQNNEALGGCNQYLVSLKVFPKRIP